MDFRPSALRYLVLPSGSGGMLMSPDDSGIEGIVDPEDVAVLIFLSQDLLERRSQAPSCFQRRRRSLQVDLGG
jgi:hypothetical protein